jgi:hypothetical protein
LFDAPTLKTLAEEIENALIQEDDPDEIAILLAEFDESPIE